MGVSLCLRNRDCPTHMPLCDSGHLGCDQSQDNHEREENLPHA